jgi:hypothetical protein
MWGISLIKGVCMKQLRLVTVAVLAAVIVSLLGGAAFAAGSGPDTAIAPPGDWQPLGVGERVWYAFNYAGDKSQIDVKLEAEPENSANFSVWTPQDVKSWASSGGVEKPTGRGSPAHPHKWSGNFPTGGKHYVVVEQAGNKPANYMLTVAGKGVALPAAAMAAEASKPAAAAAPVARAPVAQASAPEAAAAGPAPMGKGPGDAMTATADQWTALQPGEARWYAFTTDADKNVVIRLGGVPSDAVKFSVWTDETLKQKDATGVDKPVGRGAPNKASGDDQMWTGSFRNGGKYYVKVEQSGPAPAYYLLQTK